MIRRIRHSLDHPRSFAALLIVGTVLMLPALWGTWASDDFSQRYGFEGSDPYSISLMTGPLDVWRYYDANPERTRRLMDLGFMPWWTFEGLKLAVWRPVSAVTFFFDFHVLADNVVLAHVHSLLWFGTSVALTLAVYRRFLGRTWIAGLAGLLYILDDTHSMAVSWIAHRNSLIAITFGLGALLVHDSGCRRRSRVRIALAVVLFGLSLLAKEEGLATFGFLLAYTLWIDSDSWLRRGSRLLPYFLVTLIWRWTYAELGYGTYGMGTYLDPNRDLLVFAGTVTARLPVLLGGLLTVIPADLFLIWQTTGAAVHIGCVLLIVGFLGVSLFPLLRTDPVARFFAFGAFLGLVPLAATIPTDRLFCFSGVGAMGLIAQFLGGLYDRSAWVSDRRWWRRLATTNGVLLVGTHLIVAPLMLELRTIGWVVTTRIFDRTIEALPDVPENEQPDQILVTAPGVFIAGQLQYVRALDGRPLTHRVRQLALKLRPVEVTRLDQRTLSLRPQIAFSPPNPLWKFCRDDAHPMSVGERIELSRMTVVVEEVSETGWPVAARFQFEVPLEDSSLQWLRWRDNPEGFVPFVPPAIGESVVVSARD